MASGGSGSFPCRGTDELLGVMDQVTIISSTLEKALGGASGACRVVPPESPNPHTGPWRPVREGWEGRPGAAEKRVAWTVLSGGASGRLLAPDCPLPWAAGVPATTVCPALPLQPATCCRWLCLQDPGPAHVEQCHCPVYGSRDPAVQCLAGGEGWGRRAPMCLPSPPPNSLFLGLFLPFPGAFLCK